MDESKKNMNAVNKEKMRVLLEQTLTDKVRSIFKDAEVV
jgi:uncharacterized lipoprotein YajG